MSNKKPKTVKDVAVKPEAEKPVKAKAKKSNADLQAEVENLSALLMIRDATIAKLTEEIKELGKSFWQRLFGG